MSKRLPPFEEREPMLVWRFENAPTELQAISDHGGDEDWIAVIPPHLANDWVDWMDSGSRFGPCNTSEHDHPMKPGYKVRIGAHA
jgi:hypothetical protein